MRGQQNHADHRPKQRLQHRRQQYQPARKGAAGGEPANQFDRVRCRKKGEHLQRLRGHREPEQAPMNRDGQEAQHGVGQSLLSQQGALMHVDKDAKNKSNTDTDTLWLVNAPEHQHQGQKVRRPGGSSKQTHVLQHIESECCQQAAKNEEWIGRQQQLMARAHDHRLPPFLTAVLGGSTAGRGAIWVAIGLSTMT